MLKQLFPRDFLYGLSIRNISTSFCLLQATSSNSNLYKLRKSTGYALSKCKEALEKHNGNVEEATKWLNEQAQKEGWAKAEKLKNRKTAQGALVFCTDKSNNRAAIVELNCETDFVARNEKFLELSSQVALSILKNSQTSLSKSFLNKDDLVKLAFNNEPNKSIGDQIALAIGNLGENMTLRRAVLVKLEKGQHLAWYMHGSSSDPVNNCHFGKYGALVNISLTEKNENYKPFDIGRQIAQHVVGMKPLTIGELPTEETTSPSEQPKIEENETRLLYQEFIMKANTRVVDFLKENKVVVNDFVRLECGEALENESTN